MTYKPNRRRFFGRGDIHAEAMKARVLINQASIPVSTLDHGSLAGLSDDDHSAVYPNYGASETITGLWTFDRGANPPFAVAGGSTMVSGLDADKLDGAHASDLAGNGLAWTGSVIDVNAGDGIDLVSDAVAVDVTDIIDTAYGLQETSNNIQINQGNGLNFSGGALILGTPSTLTGDTSNATTTSSHTHAITTGTPSTLTPDLSNSAGSEAGLARRDHIHNIPCVAPSTITPDLANAEGTNASFARSDHIHNIPAEAPDNDSVNLADSTEGTANSFARSDHYHQLDESIVPLWTGKHTWQAVDTQHTDGYGSTLLFTDISTMMVYINPISAEHGGAIPPSVRGALTVKPAHTAQKALVIQKLAGQLDAARLLTIYDETGNDLILVTNQGDLESGYPGFVSGQVGWQISHTGDAEFQNAWIRGELHASVFVADEMHAMGGTFFALTAVVVAPPQSYDDNVICAEGSPNTFTLVLQRSYNTGLHYGAVDDVLRFKFWGGTLTSAKQVDVDSAHHLHRADIVQLGDDKLHVDDAYHYHTAESVELGGRGLHIYDVFLKVISITDNDDRDLYENEPGTADYVVEYHNNTPEGWPDAEGVTIPAGTSGVIWGEVGGATDSFTGGIMFTADLNYAPYIDIYTVNADGTPAPWELATALVPRVRVGNLDGVLGLDEEWGIAVSSDLSDSGVPHVILSNEQLSLFGTHQYWWDLGGNLRGEVDPTASGSSQILFWLGEEDTALGRKLEVRGDGTLIINADIAVGARSAMVLDNVVQHFTFDGPRPYQTNFAFDSHSSFGISPSVYSGALVGRKGKFGKCCQFSYSCYNEVRDPSGEGSDWGAGAGGGTIVEDDSGPQDGTWIGGGCAKVTTVAATTYSGTRNSSISLDLSTAYYLQFRVWCPDGYDLGYRVQNNAYGTLCAGLISGNDEWQDIYDEFTSDGSSSTHRLAIWTTDTSQGSFTFWVDGAQITTGWHKPFVYGDMPGVGWVGTAHASESLTDSAGYLRYGVANTLNKRKGTISFWAKFEDFYDWGYLFHAGSDYGEFDCYFNSGNDVYFRVGGYTTTVALNISPQTWYHFAVTWDVYAGAAAAYCDGELTDTGLAAEASFISVFSIGSTGGGQAISGYIEDFIILEEVLSADDIKAIYTSQGRVISTQAGFEITMKGLGTDASGALVLRNNGIFATDASNNEVFAMVTESYSSWGGFALSPGDIVIGDNSSAGSGSAAILWDRSEGTFGFYGDGGTSPEVEIDTDGSLLAGGGNVILNSDGISIYVSEYNYSKIKFYEGSTLVGRIYEDNYGSINEDYRLIIECPEPASAADSTTISLYAYSKVVSGLNTDDARINIYGAWTGYNSGISMVAQDITASCLSMEVSGYGTFDGGVHVGGTSDPGDNNLIVDGYTISVGGLYVGANGVDPGDNNIWVDGLIRHRGTSTPYRIREQYLSGQQFYEVLIFGPEIYYNSTTWLDTGIDVDEHYSAQATWGCFGTIVGDDNVGNSHMGTFNGRFRYSSGTINSESGEFLYTTSPTGYLVDFTFGSDDNTNVKLGFQNDMASPYNLNNVQIWCVITRQPL